MTPLASASNSQLNLEVYFTLTYTLATLLTHISDKFTSLVPLSKSNDNTAIGQLESQELSLLLQDRYLNVKSEDEVVDAVSTWF